MTNKFLIRVWARPYGAEPTIFHSKEDASVNHEPCQYDPENGQHGCSPWCEPHLVEFNTYFEAKKYLRTYYPGVEDEA